MPNFKNPNYLKTGNKRQQKAFKELYDLNIFKILEPYHPILAGTIPIGIDIPESDLDIICQCENHPAFSKKIQDHFSNQVDFNISTKEWNGIESTVARFKATYFEIEIFGQDIPTTQQNAYRHMIKEYEILNQKGDDFKSKIIELKRQGIKTEPAFAMLLGLEGDPYQALL